jgi:spore maturation protein CgeB
MDAGDADELLQWKSGEGSRVNDARIFMPTWRKFKRTAFQCGLYEAQDVLQDVDDVDLIGLDPGRGFRFKESWQRRLLWRDITKRLAWVNPGLQPVRLKQDYEAFILVCQSWWDLLYVNAINGWKDRCRTSICYIEEMWARYLPLYRHWIHALNQFDHIVLGMKGSVEAVERAIGRRCHYVPGAVDAVRFSPYPRPPNRVIDVYSIGRRWQGVHQSLLKLSARGDLFYMYDTLFGADSEASNHRQHRELLANLAKRSRYFMVAPAKMNVENDTGGQVEVGYRYFEAAGAGAVMIGQAARCHAFSELFNWPDAVIEIKPDGSDVADVLGSLAAEPERLEEISRRNAAQTLLRHDWAYRWKMILNIAGLQPGAAMEGRERRLRELAGMAQAAG